MKLNLSGKKITGILVASALFVGTLGGVSAYAANQNDAVPKNVLMKAQTAQAAVNPSSNVQDKLQYEKMIYTRADGSQNFEYEYWYNPDTQALRADYKEYTADHQLQKYQSTYQIYGSPEIITIQRDENGSPIGGTILEVDPQVLNTQKNRTNLHDFDNIKKVIAENNGTYVDTESTVEGKNLSKMLQSYQSYINDTTQANMQLFTYIDEATGLPVKDELYEDSTGEPKLFSTSTYEFNYVEKDDSLYSTEGIHLTSVTPEVK